MVSGFRAISREAALQLNIVSSFSYTTEMVIQAGKKRLAMVSVPIRTNPHTRSSRLAQSIPHFVARSTSTMIRTYAMYQPLRVFFYIGTVLFLIGVCHRPVPVLFVLAPAWARQAGHRAPS
jgi:hypothetical protein